MAMLDDKVKEQLTQQFAELKEEVDLIVFTQELECQRKPWTGRGGGFPQ